MIGNETTSKLKGKCQGLRISVPSGDLGLGFANGASVRPASSPRGNLLVTSPRNALSISPRSTSMASRGFNPFSPRSTSFFSGRAYEFVSSPTGATMKSLMTPVTTRTNGSPRYSPREIGDPLFPRAVAISPRNTSSVFAYPSLGGLEACFEGVPGTSANRAEIEVQALRSSKLFDELETKPVHPAPAETTKEKLRVNADLEQLMGPPLPADLIRRSSELVIAGNKVQKPEKEEKVFASSGTTKDVKKSAHEATARRQARRQVLRSKRQAAGVTPFTRKTSVQSSSASGTEKGADRVEKRNRRLLRNREAAMKSRRLAKEKLEKAQEELEEVQDHVERLQELNRMLKENFEILSSVPPDSKRRNVPQQRQELMSQMESFLNTGGPFQRSSQPL
ncbi:hypothetical protein NDN08_002908 [Rhodosorus marinus]|uniref:BZIP domain-containing protein n=1 Tax=Rhodosorus marinus TaxID=101924 RepID=A0AAV8UV45_9RHOD|nr:hypothetical protein NDN08_002908 [Rhodosorus marinus]